MRPRQDSLRPLANLALGRPGPGNPFPRQDTSRARRTDPLISQTLIYLSGTVVDSAGKGIEGVAVSNGELVERTDAGGAYVIEAQPGIHRFVTITCPEGFRPADSPFRRIRGEENGPFHFELAPLGEPSSRFTAAHVTDLHLITGEDRRRQGPGPDLASPDILAGDLAEVEQALSPAFMLLTGDLTNAGSIEELEAFRAVAEASRTPLHLGFGGHDANVLQARTPGRRVADGSEVRDWLDDSNAGVTLTGYFERVLGPTHYSFDCGSWHFVLYPNEEHEFSAYDQLRKERWLEADLAQQPPGRPIAVGVHMPPRTDLLERLAKHDVRLVLHGHTHTARAFRHGDMVVASTPPLCWGGSSTDPRGFRALRFDGDSFDMELRAAGRGRSRDRSEGRSKDAGHAGAPAAARAEGRSKDRSKCGLEGCSKEAGSIGVPAAARAEGRSKDRSKEAPPAGVPAAARSGSALRPVWETRLPARVHRAAPVLCQGGLVVSLQDDDDGRESGVCRVDLDAGSILWHRRTDSAVRNSVAAADGALFAMSDCGRLWSLDAETGEVLWHKDTPGFPERWMAGSPAVADGVVYAGAKSGYGACDAGTGELLWFRRFGGTLDLIADPAGDKWGAWFTPILCGRLLICLVPRRALMALDRESGRIVWEHGLPGTQDWWASPVLAGDMVVSGGKPNHLLAVRARDGAVLFDERVLDESAVADNYVSGLAAEGPLLYAGTGDGKVIACDLATGKVRWEFRTGEALLDMAPQRRGGGTVLAPPVIHRGQVVACGADGVVYRLNADTGDCEETVEFGSPVTAAPVPLEDGIAAVTRDGVLRRFGN